MLKNPFKKPVRKIFLFFVLGDIILIVFSLCMALLLKFDGKFAATLPTQFVNIAGIFILVKFFFFYSGGLYNFSWEYVGLPEVISIAKANIYSFFVLSFIYFIFRNAVFLTWSSYSILFIDLGICFLSISILRLYKRIYARLTEKIVIKGQRTLIVGAGSAGEQLLRNIIQTKEYIYLPVGFIDDDAVKRGTVIHGVKVLGACNEIPQLVRTFNIQAILIGMPSVSSGKIKDIVEHARRAKITNIKILPPFAELINGVVNIKDVKDIQLQDLLGRQEVKIDVGAIESYLKDKVVLVTGAAGSIGSELCRQIAKFNPGMIIILDQDETGIFNLSNELKDKFFHLEVNAVVGNVRDVNKVEKVFHQLRPEVVFHAAAYKHVPMMEMYPEEAIKTNIIGTYIVANASIKYNANKFVLVSTDKAVGATSIMGATKRAAEMIIHAFNQHGGARFLAVRFGNVLESRGNMFQIFKQQIEARKSVTITDPKMKRYFMSISEAVILLLEASTIKEGQIFTLDMGRLISIVDFAKELMRLLGYEPDKDIPIVFTGKRPGEKLFEECVSCKEKIISTKYDRILSIETEPSPLTSENILSYLQKIEKLAEGGSTRNEILRALKEMIPEYHPQLK